ncbi:MAG: hypothetical protein AMJ90_05020 [candidate division Zixibacteria bacterium SM23_73_2]|nr:MAG: hypothetical protein AMJ90_05020 [candidate division Zixibacteria bacterium SM23_73_2]
MIEDRFFNENSPEFQRLVELASREKPISGNVDLSRAKEVKVTRDTFLEAQKNGLSLSELLETEDYDPSDVGSPLDAFERQLAVHGIKVNGRNAITVELFYKGAPALLPEFMMREIKRGQRMRPELERIVSSSNQISNSRYTPFHVDVTPTDNKLSLRPVGDFAEIPTITVGEQVHTITVPDYGVTLKTSYKALRSKSTTQFKVLLWYIGFRLQADKMALVVDTMINGDGNQNPARVVNTETSGNFTYSDLVGLYNEFFPFEMNIILVHKDKINTILNMEEFKDPMAGFKFQKTGELVSPLGSTLIRCDDVPSDLIIGLDNRFAIEEVVSSPLMVEYDKVIQQKLEEAVISESVAYAKVIKDASLVLDSVWS